MATTDAVNTTGELSYIYPAWITALGNASGDPPTDAMEFEGCHALRVVQSAGGSRLDYADLRYTLESPMANREQPTSFERMVAVYMPDATKTRIHLGDYCTESERVGQDNEELTATSQLRPYHFGEPVRGMWVYNPLTSDQELLIGDVIFNAEIDKKVWGNQSSNTRDAGTSFIWFHPESATTDAGLTYHDTTRTLWTLKEAVEAMCELCNNEEDFIVNPSDLTVLDDAPDIRNVRIRVGARLPEALDLLLIPLGFNWYVDYDIAGKPEIKVFDIGSGDEKELYMQPAYETLDLLSTNVNQYDVTRGIGDAFNAVRVLGDYEAYEMTLSLYPIWDDANSSLTATDLAKDATDYEGREDVHRYWAANESGEYDENVICLGQYPIVPALSDVFTTYIPHRRRIEEPLTYIGDVDSEKRRPLFLEYSTDGGTDWAPFLESWSVKLLPDQIGILFDGDEPPSEIVDAAEDARIRITGVVYGDYRLQGFADKQAFAVNGRYFEQVYDMPEKFQFRQRLATTTWASVLEDGTAAADEVDDTDNIQSYAVKLRNKNHHAEVNAEFRLPGWHLEYKISDLITKINGREINLDAASTAAPTHRYPQVVERRFEYDESRGPSTVLIVDRGISTNINEGRGGNAGGGRVGGGK